MKNYFFAISLSLLLIIQLKYAEAGNTSGLNGYILIIDWQSSNSLKYAIAFAIIHTIR